MHFNFKFKLEKSLSNIKKTYTVNQLFLNALSNLECVPGLKVKFRAVSQPINGNVSYIL